MGAPIELHLTVADFFHIYQPNYQGFSSLAAATSLLKNQKNLQPELPSTTW